MSAERKLEMGEVYLECKELQSYLFNEILDHRRFKDANPPEEITERISEMTRDIINRALEYQEATK